MKHQPLDLGDLCGAPGMVVVEEANWRMRLLGYQGEGGAAGS